MSGLSWETVVYLFITAIASYNIFIGVSMCRRSRFKASLVPFFGSFICIFMLTTLQVTLF